MSVPRDYVTDASGFEGSAERLFIPVNEDEVLDVIRQSRDSDVPLTVVGAGSGLTGARVAQGGWVLSLERFRLLEIETGRAQTGAAISLLELRDRAAETRQFYAPDPTEMTASIGGSIATNASGSRSFRYGSTRRHILALRVATMDGRIREFRRGDRIDFDVPVIPLPNTTKNTAGYALAPGMDWIDLFCGSEGTLGIVLEAELALRPLPEELLSGVVFFESDDEALDAVDAWRDTPKLNMLEYLDANSLGLLRPAYADIPSNARAAVLIEAEGDDFPESPGMLDGSWFGISRADRERFRRFRHALPETVNRTVRDRGFMKMGTDYAAPISSNRKMLATYRKSLDAALPGAYVIFGHIGDAHLHVNMLPSDERQRLMAESLAFEFAREVVRLGGTVSAEHGLGKRKAHLLRIQYDSKALGAMQEVKHRLDPMNLLGRGNLFT